MSKDIVDRLIDAETTSTDLYAEAAAAIKAERVAAEYWRLLADKNYEDHRKKNEGHS